MDYATNSPRIFRSNHLQVRKSLVSVKFVSAILRPEMAAPVLWTPAKKCALSAGKPMSIKFLVLGGGGGPGIFR